MGRGTQTGTNQGGGIPQSSRSLSQLRPRKPKFENMVVALSWTQTVSLSSQRADWELLVPRLLAEGGDKVVIPAFAETDMAALLAKASLFETGEVELAKGADSACHTNSALLYRQGRGRIAIGYALSDDGYWRQHSWVVTEDGNVIETTVPRERYFGIVLDDAACERFAAQQLDGQI